MVEGAGQPGRQRSDPSFAYWRWGYCCWVRKVTGGEHRGGMARGGLGGVAKGTPPPPTSTSQRGGGGATARGLTLGGGGTHADGPQNMAPGGHCPPPTSVGTGYGCLYTHSLGELSLLPAALPVAAAWGSGRWEMLSNPGRSDFMHIFPVR